MVASQVVAKDVTLVDGPATPSSVSTKTLFEGKKRMKNSSSKKAIESAIVSAKAKVSKTPSTARDEEDLGLVHLSFASSANLSATTLQLLGACWAGKKLNHWTIPNAYDNISPLCDTSTKLFWKLSSTVLASLSSITALIPNCLAKLNLLIRRVNISVFIKVIYVDQIKFNLFCNDFMYEDN